MQQTIFMEKYPIFEMELPKSETSYQDVDAILAYLQAKIEAHPVVSYIATFDHYTHTKNLPQGQIAANMVDAKVLVFCFGVAIPNPQVLAVRPRSIGVTDLGDKFVINFLEPPMPVATQAMEEWVRSLRNI